MDLFSAIAGGAGGVGVQQLLQSPSILNIQESLDSISSSLEKISDYIDLLQKKPLYQRVVLQMEKRYAIRAKGYSHNAIFLPNNSTQINVSLPGLGGFTFTPAIGWTTLDFPDGTELWLASGSDQTILYRASNMSIGGNAL